MSMLSMSLDYDTLMKHAFAREKIGDFKLKIRVWE